MNYRLISFTDKFFLSKPLFCNIKTLLCLIHYVFCKLKITRLIKTKSWNAYFFFLEEYTLRNGSVLPFFENKNAKSFFFIHINIYSPCACESYKKNKKTTQLDYLCYYSRYRNRGDTQCFLTSYPNSSAESMAGFVQKSSFSFCPESIGTIKVSRQTHSNGCAIIKNTQYGFLRGRFILLYFNIFFGKMLQFFWLFFDIPQ